MSKPDVHIVALDIEALTVTLRDGRVWPITNLIGSADPDEATAFVAGVEGEGWIADSFAMCADLIV